MQENIDASYSKNLKLEITRSLKKNSFSKLFIIHSYGKSDWS